MSCIFCRIIKEEIPCFKVYETAKSLAFMDINPIAKNHVLVIPKEHCEKMHQLSDESLSDILPACKKVASAIGAENYNVLQNNGRLAHQEVMHVHFHIIPKENEVEGLGVGWPHKSGDMNQLKIFSDNIKSKLNRSE